MEEQPSADHKPAAPGTHSAVGPWRSAQMADRWPVTPADARAEQARLAPRVLREDRLGRVRRVAGLDVHYDPARGLAFAAAVLMDAESLELQASALACAPLRFPYVPGLLSFREAPAGLAALAFLDPRPDLVLVDGQGLAHPRRFGLACHVGLLADLPTIGVAKSRLVGEHAPLPEEAGARAPLLDRGETIGAVLRTRAHSRPLYVSIGHRVSLATAVRWTLRLCAGRRLPEPTRLADRLSRCHPGRDAGLGGEPRPPAPGSR